MFFEQLCLEFFNEWPMMRPTGPTTKNDSNGTAVKPL